jgi:hypothetical protein
VRGHRFSLGAEDLAGDLRGVATRLAADGAPNVCSFLYGASARAAWALGYSKIQTYILDEELGTTLKAAGWEFEAVVYGRQHVHTDSLFRREDQPNGAKSRWAITKSRRST